MATPQNPANSTTTPKAERRRIPMSVPVQRLQVPDKPGWHRHWFRTDRIARAQQAGYQFVRPEDVHVNNVALGGTTALSGNTDLGSQVSIVSGTTADNQIERLVLMEIQEELWQEDQAIAQARSDQVVEALNYGVLGGQQTKDAGELNMRYVSKSRTSLPEMFKKKPTR